jgi:ribosome biogenesis GTPase
LTAVRARELGRRAVVVGDRVAVVGDLSGGPDALGRIVRIEPRTSLLRRTPDDTDPVERAVVANAEVLVVVTALADPVPRPRLIDRCLVAAYDGGLVPLLCLTKNDLATADELVALYEPLGVEVVVTGPGADDPGVRQLRERLAGLTSVLFGQSGVGKSTLVNRLVPEALRAVGDVTGVGKGRHTSASAIAFELPGGGTVVDTPGVRSFGLGAVTVERVLAAFPDLAEGATFCPPGCDHMAGTPGCAVDGWVAEGRASAARLDSLRRLLEALNAADDW